MNPMKNIRLEKVTVNMGAGESGPKLEKAKKLLENLTEKRVIITKTHKRTSFGMAKHRPIGVKVTLRGDDASKFLKNAFKALEGKMKKSQFDSSGNFSLGIHEYIDIPGARYDPEIGIMGIDIAVTLERPGFRVKKRKLRPAPIGKDHQITKEESIEWVKKEFGVAIED
jgi:large subunit ribosomal protein L5